MEGIREQVSFDTKEQTSGYSFHKEELPHTYSSCNTNNIKATKEKIMKYTVCVILILGRKIVL